METELIENQEEYIGLKNPWAYVNFLVGVYASENSLRHILNIVKSYTFLCWDTERVPKDELDYFISQHSKVVKIKSWVQWGDSKYGVVSFIWL